MLYKDTIHVLLHQLVKMFGFVQYVLDRYDDQETFPCYLNSSLFMNNSSTFPWIY